jgi:hypothetical protein
VAALRTRYALPPFAWTDQTVAPGVTVVKAVHLTELRAALTDVYTATGRVAPTWGVPTIVGRSTVITAAQIAELRAAVVTIW